MLDQNTDRMWYVIGAIVIGAAIIAMGLNIFDESFDSVEDSYSTVIGVAKESVDYIGVDTTIVADGLYKYQGVPGGYRIVGFNDEYISEDLNGIQPTSIKLPELYDNQKILEIGDYAFNNMSLDEVLFPNSIEIIGWGAFRNNNLINLHLPKSIKSIDTWGFRDNAIKVLNLPEGLEYIGKHTFQGNHIEDLSIPKSVVHIDIAAFNDNHLDINDAYIYARNSDGSINEKHLVSYGGLIRTEVSIRNGVEVIGSNAFMGNNIQSVDIPSTVKVLEYSAFRFNRLKEVHVPESVEYIGPYTFQFNLLTEVRIPNKITDLYKYSFMNNKLTSVYIPDSVSFIEESTFNRNGLNGNSLNIESDTGAYGGHWQLDGVEWVKN